MILYLIFLIINKISIAYLISKFIFLQILPTVNTQNHTSISVIIISNVIAIAKYKKIDDLTFAVSITSESM